MRTVSVSATLGSGTRRTVPSSVVNVDATHDVGLADGLCEPFGRNHRTVSCHPASSDA
jgi:hypothetical protein